MKEITVSATDAGQRLDKYLAKLLPQSGKGFIYKMLRKKNIVLNGKKADGSEKIAAGDAVKLFFSDETFEKLSHDDAKAASRGENIKSENTNSHNTMPDVLYEDANILVVNKPSGLLSQKAKPSDVSLNEIICDYLSDTVSGSLFKPGICNRLDRNTSGIVVAGKNMYGVQAMSQAFRERTIGKYYICIVKGKITDKMRLNGYISKDEASNTVRIITENTMKKSGNSRNKLEGSDEYVPIETEFFPAVTGENMTLLKVHLITGKTHQIRAHLASVGHPIAGDYKYGDSSFNQMMRDKYKIKSQMLHAYELLIPSAVYTAKNPDIAKHGESIIRESDALRIVTTIPPEFLRVLKGENIWQHGIPEVLEALH